MQQQATEIKKDVKETKEIKVLKTEFIPLKDLEKEDVKKHFTLVKAKYIRTPSKTNTGFNVSIRLQLFDNVLKSLVLSPSGKFLTSDRFELIILSKEFKTEDPNGRLITEWDGNVPVRFVKGKYSDGSEFKLLEVFHKKHLYDIHFFSSDQQRLLELVEDKITWYERPEHLEKLKDTDVALDEFDY